MEHGRGDILLFVLIEVLTHVFDAFDLREPDHAYGTFAELSRSREHDVIRGLAERIGDDEDDGGVIASLVTKLIKRYVQFEPS